MFYWLNFIFTFISSIDYYNPSNAVSRSQFWWNDLGYTIRIKAIKVNKCDKFPFFPFSLGSGQISLGMAERILLEFTGTGTMYFLSLFFLKCG